ncbi:MAG: tyrosine-type recombinase/integrase [Ferruginibacter sp.]
MPSIETIHLHIIIHRGMPRIACGIQYISPINQALKNIVGIRWSRTKKKWHLPLTAESVKSIVKHTYGIAEVNIDLLREELYARKKSSESFDTEQAISTIIQNVQPIKQEGLSGENREALRLYIQMLIIKAYSPKTVKTYRNEFIRFLVKLAHIPATSINAVHVKRYMEYCATEEKLSENTLNSRLNAIKFYYENILEQDKIQWQIPRAKRPMLLPKILSEAELKRMFASIANLKHKAILFTAYSAGLRVSEVVKLRIQDIDSDRMQIFIERAKGKKDRVVNLSILLLDILRQYIRMQQPKPVYYLFGDEQNKGPYSERSAQSVFHKAKNMAGIQKEIGFHSLRHSFATHLLEKGVDVKYIKEILGHFDIRTTERYLHVSKEKLVNIISPLDTLYDFDPSHLPIVAIDNSKKNKPLP